MTKAEIVDKVAKATGIEKIAVQSVVEAFMDTVKDSLVKKEPVYLRGFGSFIIKHRAKKSSPEHHQKDYNDYSGSRYPCFQTCQGIR